MISSLRLRKLGALNPLNEATSELRVSHEVSQTAVKASKMLATPTGIEPVLPA